MDLGLDILLLPHHHLSVKVARNGTQLGGTKEDWKEGAWICASSVRTTQMGIARVGGTYSTDSETCREVESGTQSQVEMT